MATKAIALREIINLWILFFCVQSLTQSSPDGVALALRAKGTSKVCDSKKLSLSSPVLFRLHSIRGGDIIHLRSIEETEEVIAENSDHDDELVVIYFSSTDCPPCKRVAPLFSELSEEFAGKAIFCKVNVDENPAAASKFQVTGWPTFLFLKKGEKVVEVVGGSLAEATLYDWVKLMAPKEKKDDK